LFPFARAARGPDNKRMARTLRASLLRG